MYGKELVKQTLDQIPQASSNAKRIVGVVKEYDPETKTAIIEQRNRFFKNEELEMISPYRPSFAFVSDYMKDENDEDIDVAPHPQMTVKLRIDGDVVPFSIIRKKTNGENG